MTLSEKLIKKASGLNKIIAIPESEEPRMVSAVSFMLEHSKLKFLLFGKVDKIKKLFPNFDDKRIIVVDVDKFNKIESYAKILFDKRKHKGMSIEDARKFICNPMMLATVMEEAGDVDGIVCGTVTHTADVLRPVFQVIKTKPNISVASSSLIFDIPLEHRYGKNGPILFADCSVIPEPTSENLKDIALASCETYRKIVGKEPVVAFLSYSTKSGDNEDNASIVKIKEALKLTKLVAPNLLVDGELQLDAALDSDVAKIKCPQSKVAGKANVLIFPDINSANIGYKLVSRFAGLPAIGVILQGVNKPVNDISRGASVDEICVMIAITALS